MSKSEVSSVPKVTVEDLIKKSLKYRKVHFRLSILTFITVGALIGDITRLSLSTQWLDREQILDDLGLSIVITLGLLLWLGFTYFQYLHLDRGLFVRYVTDEDLRDMMNLTGQWKMYDIASYRLSVYDNKQYYTFKTYDKQFIRYPLNQVEIKALQNYSGSHVGKLIVNTYEPEGFNNLKQLFKKWVKESKMPTQIAKFIPEATDDDFKGYDLSEFNNVAELDNFLANRETLTPEDDKDRLVNKLGSGNLTSEDIYNAELTPEEATFIRQMTSLRQDIIPDSAVAVDSVSKVTDKEGQEDD